jgi:hypothetical protein
MPTTSPTLETLIVQINTEHRTDPVLDRLERAVELADRLGELSENLVGYFVDESRRAGESWSEIGSRLGVSRQAAQKRFIVADGESDRFWDRTSKGFKAVIDLAEAAARDRNQGFLGTEHVLLALSDRPRDPATAILASIGVEPKLLRGAVVGRIGPLADIPGSTDAPLTAKLLRVLQLAKREAMRMESDEIDTVHLALALLAINEGIAFEILSNLGVTYDGVLEAALIASDR